MKKLILLVSILFLFLTPFIVYGADPSYIYTISANPGEDSSKEIRINWHTDVGITDSYVVYTEKTDTYWKNFLVQLGECQLNTAFTMLNGSGETFNQNGAVLSNLKEDTEYMYKITDGKKESDVRYFKTAAKEFSFIWTSDFHAYYDDARRLKNATANINEAIAINGGVDFIFSTGDTIAHGGTYKWWKQVSEANWMKQYMYVDTLGNHDWMTSKGTTVALGASNKFFSACHNNPKNGYSGMENICYYFYYGSALFICLNTEEYTQAQYNWCESVLKNAKAQYIFIFQHYEAFTGNGTKKSSGYTRWHDLCDKYDVDVFFSGNSHRYVRSKSIYKNEASTDPKKGTVYMVAPSSDGDRGQDYVPFTSNQDILDFGWAGGVYQVACSIVNVTSTGIKTRLINKGGEILDEAYIPAKRSANEFIVKDLTGFDKKAFEESFSFSINSVDLSKSRLKIGDLAYEAVRKIKVYNNLNEEEVYYFDSLTEKSRYLNLDNLSIGNLSLAIEIQYYDDTISTVILEVKNQIKWGTISNLRVSSDNLLTWDESIDKTKVKEIDVFLDSEKIETVEVGKGEVNLNGLSFGKKVLITLKVKGMNDEYLEEKVLEYTLPVYYTVTFEDGFGNIIGKVEVESGMDCKEIDAPEKEGLVFKSWDVSTNNITSNLTVKAIYEVKKFHVVFKNDDGIVLKEEDVKIGESATPPFNPTKEGFDFKGWNRNFENVTSDLEIIAIFEESIITYIVRFVDSNGNLLKEEEIEKNMSASAPDEPTLEGYKFIGWDKDFTNITENITVKALFEKNKGCTNSLMSTISTLFIMCSFLFIRKKY